jgi:DNA modification methylase
MKHLYTEDCLTAMRRMPENYVDSIVTDPPYGLEFMGNKWDKEYPGKDYWAEALRVAKPGAHLLSFGGTRTYHRIACVIEDAGWEIRDCLMWIYGSGFPKSRDLGDGRGTTLKPAWEPIIMARKPFKGTVADNIRKWGTGGLYIDATRITTTDNLNGGAYAKNGTPRDDGWGMQRGGAGEFVQPSGRWPANILLDDESAALLGEPSRFFYCAKASRVEKGENNSHQTVKPLALMEYLVKMVTPPGGVVLDPFAGTGTTCIAAKRNGYQQIGIESNLEYIEIMVARLCSDIAKSEALQMKLS